MIDKRRLILKATERNWSEIEPGDWLEIKWYIFNDSSYEMISSFYAIEEKKITTGLMDNKDFSKLKKALKKKPWKSPFVNADAEDGEAWQIESYSETGRIEKTSGELDYIYGHTNLEKIARLLPYDCHLYDSYKPTFPIKVKTVKLRYISDKLSIRFKKGLVYEGFRAKNDLRGCLWCFHVEDDDDPGDYGYPSDLFEVVPDEGFDEVLQKL